MEKLPVDVHLFILPEGPYNAVRIISILVFHHHFLILYVAVSALCHVSVLYTFYEILLVNQPFVMIMK